MLAAIVASIGVGMPSPVRAEGKALHKALAEKKALEGKVDDLDRKVRLLEQRLEQALDATREQKAVAAPAPAAKEEQFQALDQKMRVLERKWELDQEQATAMAKDAPMFAAGKEGFSLKSADGSYQLRIRGYLQGDGRFFADDKERATTDTFLLRRVRPILEGTVAKYFDFRIMTDFGGGTATVQDAYLDAHPWTWGKLRVGKYKPPVGLERLQSGSELLFIERGLPTNLVPNRDVGAQVYGDVLDGALSYALGAFNGVADGGNGDLDNNDSTEFAGRLFAQPFKNSSVAALQGLGVGLAGTYGDQRGSTGTPFLSTLRTQGQQTFFSYRSDGTAAGTTVANGIHSRFAPQGYYYYGPFGLLWEYVRSSQRVQRGKTHAILDNEAWQVMASYVLTGENASYRSVSPAKPFDLTKGDWGAVEIAVRYGELNVDKDAFPFFADPTRAARVAESWGLGLNWYLNRNVKFQLNYEQTDFTGGSATGERPKERVMLGRFQVSFFGDVFISWENEALLAVKELGKDKFEVIIPSVSILAEPPVTVVDKVANKHGTRDVAQAYLEYLYTEEGQKIAAKNFYRPRLASVAAQYTGQFPRVTMFTVDEVFSGWEKAQKAHFADGGTFDQIYQAGR